MFERGLEHVYRISARLRRPLKPPQPHNISSLVREEEGAGPNDPLVLIVPPGCKLLRDNSFDLPASWDLDPDWYRRNDMQDIIEHNVGIQLAKAQMIGSAAGTCHCRFSESVRCLRSLPEAVSL